MTPNIETIIKDHVTLSIRCIDRIYAQGYMPKLQTSGGLCYFLRDHLGHPIPSPALFPPMHDRFVKGVEAFAADGRVPFIKFESGQDKDAIVAAYRARFSGQDGVVVIGVAQEKARAFKAHKRTGPRGGVTFDFTRQSVAVNHYYFYVQDPVWGPAFLKIGTYVPYPVKLCLNGHEWAKQQLRRAGIPFTSLDNGFLTCADPARLQAICDQLGPHDLQQFFDRWSHRVPWPLRAEDRAAGYDHRVTLCQLEVRPPRSGPIALSASTHAPDSRPGLRLSDARDHGRRRAESPHRIQTFPFEAVLQRRARPAERADDQQPERLRFHQRTRPAAGVAGLGR
ncbi:MAG: hypothetical protein HYZ58_07245 [Acidobacteria bacterium]|nr:hypothetical protein [Acidobacteriota bacterium]